MYLDFIAMWTRAFGLVVGFHVSSEGVLAYVDSNLVTTFPVVILVKFIQEGYYHVSCIISCGSVDVLTTYVMYHFLWDYISRCEWQKFLSANSIQQHLGPCRIHPLD